MTCHCTYKICSESSDNGFTVISDDANFKITQHSQITVLRQLQTHFPLAVQFLEVQLKIIFWSGLRNSCYCTFCHVYATETPSLQLRLHNTEEVKSDSKNYRGALSPWYLVVSFPMTAMLNQILKISTPTTYFPLLLYISQHLEFISQTHQC